MVNPIKERIKDSLQSVDGLYHRLILLVGEAGSGKTSVLLDLADDFTAEVINVNLELSSEMLGLTAKQRTLRLSDLLSRLVEHVDSPVILDNLEVLFDKDLKQDPLRLLQNVSRNRPIIASWNGAVVNGKLFYAEVGHPEYRNYDSVDAIILQMAGMATPEPGTCHREAGQA